SAGRAAILPARRRGRGSGRGKRRAHRSSEKIKAFQSFHRFAPLPSFQFPRDRKRYGLTASNRFCVSSILAFQRFFSLYNCTAAGGYGRVTSAEAARSRVHSLNCGLSGGSLSMLSQIAFSEWATTSLANPLWPTR